MSYKDKLGEAKKLVDQAVVVLGDAEASAEDKEKAAKMFTDAKALRAEGVQLQELQMTAAELDKEWTIAQDAARKAVEDKQPPLDRDHERRQSPAEFKDWGEYLTSIWRTMHPDASIRGKRDLRLQRFQEHTVQEQVDEKGQKQLVESVGASGGFLVPTEFDATLRAVQNDRSLVRGRNPTIIRMRRRAVQIPVLDQTNTTAGTPCWYGGMSFYWAEEAASKTYTEPTFRQAELVAHKLIGYTRASDELLDDSAISLSDFLSGPMGMAGGVAWYEDFAFIQGTGAGQPLGVIPAGATITVPRAVAGTISFVDLTQMMENFLPTAGNGCWFMTQSAMRQIIELNGPAGNPSYIWQPNARDGIPGFILGLPVFWTEKCPLIGTSGDVILADWSYYLIGDRQSTTVETTQYDYWRYDQTSWRAVHRVDGQPWLSAPLTYQDGTTQVSPFVILGDVAT